MVNGETGKTFKTGKFVAKNQKHRKQHVPKRTCVGCRQTLSKRNLMRIVRSSEGIRYDPTGKANGRGAYVHNQRACWESAMKGSLANALRAAINEADHKHLQEVIDSLPLENDV